MMTTSPSMTSETTDGLLTTNCRSTSEILRAWDAELIRSWMGGLTAADARNGPSSPSQDEVRPLQEYERDGGEQQGSGIGEGKGQRPPHGGDGPEEGGGQRQLLQEIEAVGHASDVAQRAPAEQAIDEAIAEKRLDHQTGGRQREDGDEDSRVPQYAVASRGQQIAGQHDPVIHGRRHPPQRPGIEA